YHCSTALSVDVRTFISPTKRIQFVPVAPSRRPVQFVPLSRPVVTELVQSERRFRRTTTRRVSSETGRLLRLIHRTSRGEKSAERARIPISNPIPPQRHRVIPNRVDHLAATTVEHFLHHLPLNLPANLQHCVLHTQVAETTKSGELLKQGGTGKVRTERHLGEPVEQDSHPGFGHPVRLVVPAGQSRRHAVRPTQHDKNRLHPLVLRQHPVRQQPPQLVQVANRVQTETELHGTVKSG